MIECPGTRLQRRCAVRQEFVAAVKMRQRLLVPPELVEQGSGSIKRVLLARIELNGLAEHLKGILVPALPLECRAEIDEVARLGIEPDRACYPLDGMVVLAALQGHQPQEMQRIGVVGLRLQDLPAA